MREGSSREARWRDQRQADQEADGTEAKRDEGRRRDQQSRGAPTLWQDTGQPGLKPVCRLGRDRAGGRWTASVQTCFKKSVFKEESEGDVVGRRWEVFLNYRE